MSTAKNNNTKKHKYFMKLAYNQANKILGNTGENPAVGCVIIKNNELISLGHTNIGGRPHAEKRALSSKIVNYKGSSLYSTLEPCSHYGKTPPCIDTIKQKKIKLVYFSKFDPDERNFDKATRKLSKYNIKTFKNISKTVGDKFYRDFYIRKKTNKIFITSKLATSKDLFTSNKRRKWITNFYSRKCVHYLRSKHDSILTTSSTILNDNPMLNCRINGLGKFSPKRFIIDKNLEVPVTSKIIQTSNKIDTCIFYNFIDKIKLQELKRFNVKTIRVELKNDHLNFNSIVYFLRNNGFHRVFVEAGIKFNKFLLENNYINDFYHFYSNQFFRMNGSGNSNSFFSSINKVKKSKRKVKTFLFKDKLIKYFVK